MAASSHFGFRPLAKYPWTFVMGMDAKSFIGTHRSLINYHILVAKNCRKSEDYDLLTKWLSCYKTHITRNALKTMFQAPMYI